MAITQEDGFEAIFGKLNQGRYTIMPQGSQVFTAAQTDNLYGFASDPQKFINDIVSKTSSFLSSKYSGYNNGLNNIINNTKHSGDVIINSAPTTNYNIQGYIDKNTLMTMDNQERKRYELFKKHFMLEMLREKNNL